LKPATARHGGGWFTVAMLLWWFGGYGLVVYGIVADRGPFAFLIGAQEALFGGASFIVGGLAGTVLIFFVPGWLSRLFLRLRPHSALAAALNRRLDIAETHLTNEAARRAWAERDPHSKAARLRHFRNGALVVAILAMPVAWGVLVWARVSANADAGRPLTQILLRTDQAVSLGGASPWVQVANGVPRRDVAVTQDYRIRGTAHHDVYTPIVPPDWHEGDRIPLLELDRTYPHQGEAAPPPAPSGAIEGELSTGGTRADVAALFQRQGYAVGDWTAVLRRVPLHGVIPGEDAVLEPLVWVMAGMIAFLALICALVWGAQARRWEAR
jgi:hypothetical protein